jgi:hypothetical protein
MSRTLLLRLALPAALLASALAAAPHAAVERFGPPWISIESPPNPHDRTTRGAFLVVRTYHHGDLVGQGLRGTAEGIVGGQRRTVTLRFDETSHPGVYALKRQWPTEGRWALVVTTGTVGDGASALVTVADDRVASVVVPTRQQDGWTIPRAVTRAEIDAALGVRVASSGR